MVDDLHPAGTAVRLVSDPSRKGTLTGKHRTVADTVKYQVHFDEGNSYHPDYELEVIDHGEADDPWEMLQAGRFGRQRDLRRNLTHIQLSGRLANVVYSMDTTNTDFYAYQFKPVLSFLESPSKGLLIADEVGLGKTIEAGLIWTELRARYDARRLLIVCPAMLREKWALELNHRFGITARIVDAAELARELETDKNRLPDGQGLVCSLQGIRPPRDWNDPTVVNTSSAKLARVLDERSDSDPVFDLVVIDEAHYLRNPESQSAKLGRMLHEVTESLLLLSATPINLDSDDLYHLLNLVDPDSFGDKLVFPNVLRANEPLQRARRLSLDMKASASQIRDELMVAKEHPMLASSRQLGDLLTGGAIKARVKTEAGRVALANRIERINLLQHAVSRTRKVEVTEWRVVREPRIYFVPLDPDGPERRFYDAVTDAIREYAVERDITAGFLLAAPQKQVSSCMYAAALAWKNRRDEAQIVHKDRRDEIREALYEDFGAEDVRDDDFAPLISHLCNRVLPDTDLAELRRNDGKYLEFRNLVKNYLAEHRDEKIIVFSFFRGTIAYLSDRLADEGVVSTTLVGGMAESKQAVIDEFKASKNSRVLISSEVASEGVDLQFCRVLINYDLPWNPMKIEQRIGRLDRIGQKAEKISIRSLCYADTIDQRIYEKLLDRLRIFERALGGMEAVLGDEISSLTGDLLSQRLTKEEEERRIEATALAVEKIRREEEELESQASHLIAHGGYILEQVKAAHALRRRITDEDLFTYVVDYLNKFGQGYELKQLSDDELVFSLRLPPKMCNDLGDYLKRRGLLGRTLLATGDKYKCRFVNRVTDPSSRDEYISQFHPLIRFIGFDIMERNESFSPIVATRISVDRISRLRRGIYGFAISRWTFEGLRTDEEIRVRACLVGTGDMLSADASWDLINATRLDGKDWFEAPTVADLDAAENALDACDRQLAEDFVAAERDRDNENTDRVQFQIQSTETHLARKLRTLEDVLAEHRRLGRERLIAPTKGRMDKETQRFAVQIERLKARERLRSSHFDVAMGLIEVY